MPSFLNVFAMPAVEMWTVQRFLLPSTMKQSVPLRTTHCGRTTVLPPSFFTGAQYEPL